MTLADAAFALCLLASVSTVALCAWSFIDTRRRYRKRAETPAPIPEPPRRTPLPSNALPTRAEVRAACEHATATSPCHDRRCPARGRHRCHDLDCRTHWVRP